MEENKQHRKPEVFSKKIKAGKRTYFFDVKATRGDDDYYITITESIKKLDGEGYSKHKIFLYKEDFNKFIAALTETVDHVKDELMPEFNFNKFDEYISHDFTLDDFDFTMEDENSVKEINSNSQE